MAYAMEPSIEEKVSEALSRVPISTGDNLLGFRMDMDYILLASRDILCDVEVQETGDAKCLLIATARVIEPDLPADYVAKRLVEMWLGNLRYRGWEAHSIEKQNDCVILRFVTTSGYTPDDICVTGKIVVSGLT